MAIGQASPKVGKVIDIPTNAPTIGTATDDGTGTGANVAFTAPSTSIGGPVFKYTVTSSPGSFTGTGTSSPVNVQGLTTGSSYTFTVIGQNPTGNGPASSASNSVTTVDAPQSLLFAGSASPYVHGYVWSNSTGFGTKFSNPASLTGSGSYGLSIDPANTNIAIGVDADPRLAAYPWSNSTGFGTRYSNPSGTTDLGSGIITRWSSSGNVVFIVQQGTNGHIGAWAFTSGSGFGSKYAMASNKDTGTGFGMDYNATLSKVIDNAVGSVFNWNDSTGWGTKYSSPETGGSGSVSIAPSGAYVVRDIGSGAPYFRAYAFSASGYGTAFTGSPSNNSSGGGVAVKFNPSSDAVVATLQSVSSGTEYIFGAPFSSGGWGTKYSAPGTGMVSLSNTYGDNISFNKLGTAVATMANSTPWIQVWAFNKTTGFGTKYSNPATTPAASNNVPAFTN